MDPNHNHSLILSSEAIGDGQWAHKVQLASGTRTVQSESLQPRPSDLIDWLAFRRDLIASSEYALSIALANQIQAVAVADAKLSVAIDCCCAHQSSEPEVEACRSALALYLSALPSTTEGQAVAARLTALMEEYGI